jgi:hypothetical protein
MPAPERCPTGSATVTSRVCERRGGFVALACTAYLALICALAFASAAVATSALYVLADDASGFECYSYAHETPVVVALRSLRGAGRRPVLRGLDASIFNARFSDDARHMTWLRGRTVWYGDLTGGRARRLVTLGSVPDGDWQLSADRRFIWYSTRNAVAVRALAGGGTLRLAGVESPSWSPQGHRLAYTDDVLEVLDVDSGMTRSLGLSSGSGYVPTWSPDGKFIDLASQVVAVADGQPVSLPPLGGDPSSPTFSAWRPQHGHLLLVDRDEIVNLVDVGNSSRVWRKKDVIADLAQLQWSLDDRWLADPEGDEVFLIDGASGHDVRTFTGMAFQWLGNALGLGGGQTLRIARPPNWKVRLLMRVRAGHDVFPLQAFHATAAGLRLLVREFGPRGRARDCA